MKTKTTLNETVREALGIALLQLMETRPFHAITVSEIAGVAGVSRSSFYRNFTDKHQLLTSHITALYRSFFRDTEIAVGNIFIDNFTGKCRIQKSRAAHKKGGEQIGDEITKMRFKITYKSFKHRFSLLNVHFYLLFYLKPY